MTAGIVVTAGTEYPVPPNLVQSYFASFVESMSWPPPDMSETGDGKLDRKRKRKSRWGGDEKEKAFIPGMPTVIPPGLSKEQERLYLCK